MKRLAYLCLIGMVCCLFLLTGAIRGLIQTEQRMMNRWNHPPKRVEINQITKVKNSTHEEQLNNNNLYS